MTKAQRVYSKLKHKWNYTVGDARGIIGLNKKQFEQARGARIVVYHGLCETDPTRFNTIFLKIKTFEEHLRFYKKYFHIVSLEDYYQQKFSVDRFNICITFDDGFANNYTYVLPLMEQYRVPMTFFITGIADAGYNVLWNDMLALAHKYGPPELQFGSDWFFRNKRGAYVSGDRRQVLKEVLQGEEFERKAELVRTLEAAIPAILKMREQDYWLQLTAPEIRELSKSPLATIGCHGYFHNDLSRISIESARDELTRGKQFLETVTQTQINALAFPYGNYSRDVVRVSKSIGFNQLLTAGFKFPEDYADATMRERFIVNPFVSVNNQMLATIHGNYCS